MSLDPRERLALQLEANRLASRLASTDSRLTTVETTPQLAHSAIMNGALSAYINAQQTMVIGLQYDGTNAAVPVSSPAPPQPYQPTAVARPGGIAVAWDGTFADSLGTRQTSIVAPMDFARVDVVVTTDSVPNWLGILPSHAFTSPRGGEIFISLPVNTYRVALITRGQAGNASAASVPTQVTAAGIVVASDGAAPAGVPSITVIGGLGAVLARVTTPITNTDPVQYEYHVSPTPFSAVSNDAATIAHRGPETSVTIRRFPNGDPIGPDVIGETPTPVYVRVIAYDSDGWGPQSAQATATPVQVTSADIAANQGWFGYLQATDFRSGQISGDVLLGGRFATLGAGENVGQGWEASAAGARWFDAAGKIVVDIPSNLSVSNPATFSGKGVFTQLEAIGGMTMRGTSRILQGSELVLSNQQQPPGIGPTVGVDLDSVPLDLTAAMAAVNSGQPATSYVGIQWDGTALEWLVAAYMSTRLRVLRFDPTTGAYKGQTVAITVPSTDTIHGWAMTATRHLLTVQVASGAVQLQSFTLAGASDSELFRPINDATESVSSLGIDGTAVLAASILADGQPMTRRFDYVTGLRPQLLPAAPTALYGELVYGEGTYGGSLGGWQPRGAANITTTSITVGGTTYPGSLALNQDGPGGLIAETAGGDVPVLGRRIYRLAFKARLADATTLRAGDSLTVVGLYTWFDAAGAVIGTEDNVISTTVASITEANRATSLTATTVDVLAPPTATRCRVGFRVTPTFAAPTDSAPTDVTVVFYDQRFSLSDGWNVSDIWYSNNYLSNAERGVTDTAAATLRSAVPAGAIRRTEADMGAVERVVLGPSRVVSAATVRPYRTVTPGAVDGYEWPGPVAIAEGFTYGNGAFHVLTRGRIHKYGTVTWAAGVTDQWFAGYTWRDTDTGGSPHETGLSPLTRFTMKKRHRVTLTTGTVPSHSGNTDAVNNVGFYIGRLGMGTQFTVSSVANTANVATVVSATAHGLVVGETVEISGTGGQPGYYGAWTVASVPNTTTFTFARTAPDAATTTVTGVVAVRTTAPDRTLMAYQSSLNASPSVTTSGTLLNPNPTTATSTNTITNLTYGPDPAGAYAFPNTSPAKVTSTMKRSSSSQLPLFGVDGDGNGRWDDLMPPGTMLTYCGAVVPTNWRQCNAQSLSAALYPDLYAALGGSASPHGVNLGAGTFQVPNKPYTDGTYGGSPTSTTGFMNIIKIT